MKNRDNPLDGRVDKLVSAMKEQQRFMKGFSKGVKPFNSVELSPEEERAIYEDPTRAFPGQNITNPVQARQMLAQSMGPVDYIKWVEKMEGADVPRR